MKKIILGMVAAVTLLSSVTVFADTPSVYFNDEKMSFDVDPYITYERTMVPFRAVFEAVGADVIWDDDTKTVIAVKDDQSVTLQVGSYDAFVNSEKTTLEVPAEITGDYTFVPLRFVMESLGATVTWDDANYSVYITQD